jgi:hypothetical protein
MCHANGLLSGLICLRWLAPQLFRLLGQTYCLKCSLEASKIWNSYGGHCLLTIPPAKRWPAAAACGLVHVLVCLALGLLGVELAGTQNWQMAWISGTGLRPADRLQNEFLMRLDQVIPYSQLHVPWHKWKAMGLGKGRAREAR